MSPTKRNLLERFVLLKIGTKTGSELYDCGKNAGYSKSQEMILFIFSETYLEHSITADSIMYYFPKLRVLTYLMPILYCYLLFTAKL